MSSDPSLLELARKFERYKSRRSNAAPDSRVALLLEFWNENKTALSADRSGVYNAQLGANCETDISAEALADFSPDELTQLEEIALSLAERNETGQSAGGALNVARGRLARMYFWLGECRRGLALCAELAGADLAGDTFADDLDEIEPFEALELAISRYGGANAALDNLLQAIKHEWEATLNGQSADSVCCALVKRDDARTRGHLQKFTAKIAPAHGAKSAPDEEDLVSFEHQIDDPRREYEDAVRAALRAARPIAARQGVRAKGPLAAYIRLANGDCGVAGASIGLAAGLVSVTQLLQTELFRRVRFISTAVAVTGGIDKHGALSSVNHHTLKDKLARVFYSPLKYFVLPVAQLAEAGTLLDELNKRFPNRRLILIGAKALADVIDDLNIIRSEKLCIGEYAAKTVYKYSRAAKVQVPLLLGLVYLLVCLVYPKAWIGFDWNPAEVRATESGFEVFNLRSQKLWAKDFGVQGLQGFSKGCVGNLDSDEDNEVVFIPCSQSTAFDFRSYVFVYDNDGELLWNKDCVILNEYPGDTLRDQLYTPVPVHVEQFDMEPIVITGVNRSEPARQHVAVWSSSGEKLTWYVNAGFCEYAGLFDINEDGVKDLVFRGYNNRVDGTGCASVFALPVSGGHGASPPYNNALWNLDKLIVGNQIHYMCFPKSNLYTGPYNHIQGVFFDSDSKFRVELIELEGRKCGMFYTINSSGRVIHVLLDDTFVYVLDSISHDQGGLSLNQHTYALERRQSVLYWSGFDWVTEESLQAR